MKGSFRRSYHGRVVYEGSEMTFLQIKIVFELPKITITYATKTVIVDHISVTKDPTPTVDQVQVAKDHNQATKAAHTVSCVPVAKDHKSQPIRDKKTQWRALV